MGGAVGVFLSFFWWSFGPGLQFLCGLSPHWLALVPGCC